MIDSSPFEADKIIRNQIIAQKRFNTELEINPEEIDDIERKTHTNTEQEMEEKRDRITQFIKETMRQFNRSGRCRKKIVLSHVPYLALNNLRLPETEFGAFLKKYVIGRVDALISADEHLVSWEGIVDKTNLFITGGGGAPLHSNINPSEIQKAYGRVDKDGNPQYYLMQEGDDETLKTKGLGGFIYFDIEESSNSYEMVFVDQYGIERRKQAF